MSTINGSSGSSGVPNTSSASSASGSDTTSPGSVAFRDALKIARGKDGEFNFQYIIMVLQAIYSFQGGQAQTIADKLLSNNDAAKSLQDAGKAFSDLNALQTAAQNAGKVSATDEYTLTADVIVNGDATATPAIPASPHLYSFLQSYGGWDGTDANIAPALKKALTAVENAVVTKADGVSIDTTAIETSANQYYADDGSFRLSSKTASTGSALTKDMSDASDSLGSVNQLKAAQLQMYQNNVSSTSSMMSGCIDLFKQTVQRIAQNFG